LLVRSYHFTLHHCRRWSRLVRTPGIRERNANEQKRDERDEHESEDVVRALEDVRQRQIEEVTRGREQTHERFSRDQTWGGEDADVLDGDLLSLVISSPT